MPFAGVQERIVSPTINAGEVLGRSSADKRRFRCVLEEICGTGEGRRRVIAVFCDEKSGAGEDGGGGGDVESVVAVAAGAYYVDLEVSMSV
jgi:hypothetical protein